MRGMKLSLLLISQLFYENEARDNVTKNIFSIKQITIVILGDTGYDITRQMSLNVAKKAILKR